MAFLVSSSVVERNGETPTRQSEEDDLSKDSRRNEEGAVCSAEDRKEDWGEPVTQQFVEISKEETVEMESEKSEKKHGEGKVGLLWKKDYMPLWKLY